MLEKGNVKPGRAFKNNFLFNYCQKHRPMEKAPKAKSMETAMKDTEVRHWERAIRKAGEERWHQFRCRDDPRYRSVLIYSGNMCILEGGLSPPAACGAASLVVTSTEIVEANRNAAIHLNVAAGQMKVMLKEAGVTTPATWKGPTTTPATRKGPTIETHHNVGDIGDNWNKDSTMAGRNTTSIKTETKSDVSPATSHEPGPQQEMKYPCVKEGDALAKTQGMGRVEIAGEIAVRPVDAQANVRPQRQKRTPARFDPSSCSGSRNNKRKHSPTIAFAKPTKKAKVTEKNKRKSRTVCGELNGKVQHVTREELMEHFHKSQFYWDLMGIRKLGIKLVNDNGKENQELLEVAWSIQNSLRRKEAALVGLEASQQKVRMEKKIREGDREAQVTWRCNSYYELRGLETKDSLVQHVGKKLLPAEVDGELKRLKGCLAPPPTTKRWKADRLQGCMRRQNPHNPHAWSSDCPKAIVDCAIPGFFNVMGKEKVIAKKLWGCLKEANTEVQTDSVDVILSNMMYSLEYKPRVVRLILLVESPGHTPAQDAIPDHELCPRLRHFWGGGIYKYTNQLYNPTYGLKAGMQGPDIKANSTGTPSFWKLVAALTKSNPKLVLKGDRGNNHASIGKLLGQRRRVLAMLMDMGVWLLDVSPGGLYFPDASKFQWGANGQAQRRATDSCSRLKECLIMSWELCTKHLVNAAYKQGGLAAIVPLCKRVGDSLTQQRIERAVGESVEVLLPEWHPNAWLDSSCGEAQVEKIVELVDKFC